VMNDIWQLAKCNDMVIDDEFFTFEQLALFDPRILPVACSRTAITQDHIDLAENKGGKYAYFDSMYFMDKQRKLTFYDFMDPRKCLDPVLTGVTVVHEKKTVDMRGNVKVTGTTAYPEKTCINPGCYYHQPTDKCLQ
jgi:hypothetical protein